MRAYWTLLCANAYENLDKVAPFLENEITKISKNVTNIQDIYPIRLWLKGFHGRILSNFHCTDNPDLVNRYCCTGIVQ